MKEPLSRRTTTKRQHVIASFGKVVDRVGKTPEGYEYTDVEIYRLLKGKPMWCGDETKHIGNPDYHHDFCCTTHVAGLPQHAATMEEMPPTPFQLDFIRRVFKAVKKPKKIALKIWKRLAHKFHISKGRQMGFTEWVLRVIFHFCFDRYVGRSVAIIAATNGILAKKNLRRFMRLFKNIRNVVPQGIYRNSITLTNNTSVVAYPATDEPITGDTKIAAIFMDESAKWIKVDDQPVFNGIMPIVRSNGSDLFLVSTFKGAKKMFYDIWKKRPNDFVFMKYTIKATIGNLYTKEEVDEMLATSVEDPQQEYMAVPSTGRDSMYGVVKDSQKESVSPWEVYDDPVEELEDDAYVEPDDGMLNKTETTVQGKESYTWGDYGGDTP